jgi:hypothetical protein
MYARCRTIHRHQEFLVLAHDFPQDLLIHQIPRLHGVVSFLFADNKGSVRELL